MLVRIRAVRLAVVIMLTTALTGVSAPPATAVPPPAPVIKVLEVQSDARTITVTWDHVGGTLDGYEIHYRPTGTTSWLWSSSADVGTTSGSWVPFVANRSQYSRDFVIKDAKPGASYDISLRAVSTTQERSDRTSATTTVVLTPAVQGVTAVSKASGELTVTWSAVTAIPFLQYDLYLGAGNAEPSWRTAIPQASTTSYTFKGLTPGQFYTVGVRATQSNRVIDGATRFWVRSPLATATLTLGSPIPPIPPIPPASSTELFTSSATSPFISTATGKPVVINGVNIKRSVYRTAKDGWRTAYAKEEIIAMGTRGTPAFNTVRIAMDWPYFQTGPTTFNSAAFAQLDILIDEAIAQGLYVILDPIHIMSVSSTQCTEDTIMLGAHRNIPAWAWTKVGEKPGVTCENADRWTVKTDDALASTEAANYLKYVLARYNPDTTTPGGKARGRQVIAIDLVNEPNGSSGSTTVSAASAMKTLIATVYGPWLADTGPKSLRTTDSDKILIIEPIAGNGTLISGIDPVTKKPVVIDLTPVARPNVVMSFHDYFGSVKGTDATYGFGYGAYGFANAITTTDRALDNGKGPYDPTVQSYATRKADHTRYISQFKSWAAEHGMPLYIGEYGILNSCTGVGTGAAVLQYAKDTNSIYDQLGISRTAWTNGSWDNMAIWWRGPGSCEGTATKKYLPHAAAYTGGALRN